MKLESPAPPRRVLSVSTILPRASEPGAGVFVLRRQASLPAADFHCEALRMRPWFPGIGFLKPHLGGGADPVEERMGLRIEDRRFPYLPGAFKTLDGPSLGRTLKRWIARSGRHFDLLDGHFAYPAGHGVVRCARSLDLPSVVTLRGTMPGYLGDARRTPIIETLRGATRLIAVSTSLAEAAREAAGDDLAVRVIGNGVDTALFCPGEREAARRELGVNEVGPILLTVGGLVPRKGVQRVLEALPELRRRHPDLLYMVVGGGSAEGDFRATLESRIAELGLQDCVRLLGAVAPEDLPRYYRAADLFVLATANEGWANALQEALACGTPVVTTDVGGNREVLGAESRGLVIPFGDPDALQSALIGALEMSWDREAIANWGMRRNWLRVGEEVAAVYREAIDGN
jgi:glycosyltransferase involved in cell wall biosynthesis